MANVVVVDEVEVVVVGTSVVVVEESVVVVVPRGGIKVSACAAGPAFPGLQMSTAQSRYWYRF
jgi:hypothetical protein